MSLNLQSIAYRAEYGFVTKQEIYDMLAEIDRLRADVSERVDKAYQSGLIDGKAEGLRIANEIVNES